jgi:ubiquinone/menaquinone biosynthesis C-methylase UbiE
MFGGLRARVAGLKSRIIRRLLPRDIQEQIRQLQLEDPRIAAKFYPYKRDDRSYLLTQARQEERDSRSDFPIPPRDLQKGSSGLRTPEAWLAFGQARVDRMKKLLAASGFVLGPEARVLDFGCATANMLRNFEAQAITGEAWGVDIVGDCISWCQQHMSPPFKFATSTSFPHLPFEDRYFDLVYAGSVFTHIADLAEFWLLELRRILRPGGRLFLTVHDTHFIRSVLEENTRPRLAETLREFDKEFHFTSTDFATFAINRIPGPGGKGQAQVFHDTQFLRRHWGNYLKVVSIVPKALGPRGQTAVILEK